jgi:signal transduction histidine kinase
MSKESYKRKGNFKGFLFVFGLLIIGAVLFYTQHLVNILQEKSRESINFRVRVLEENINNPNVTIDLGFLLTEVIQGIDFPVIYSDVDRIPQLCKNVSPAFDSLRVLPEDVIEILKEEMLDLDAENPPIPISYQGFILGYYHYGASPIIRKLRWLPFIEIAIVIIFILIGYIGFSQIKKSEQRHIWVGMAKETAHQLGTPLSSIQGWIELLKEKPSELPKALKEMDLDLQRLSKVALRFSQIGSVPSLKAVNIVENLTVVAAYFRKRLPQLKKKIVIKEEYRFYPLVKINSDLFEWVIENLLKNALDAIEEDHGIITIRLMPENEESVAIDISDTGKGINSRDKKEVFKPGFSTKRRGWGLGLSLSKRIIEEYHGGKLFISDTRIGKGTTFRLVFKST